MDQIRLRGMADRVLRRQDDPAMFYSPGQIGVQLLDRPLLLARLPRFLPQHPRQLVGARVQLGLSHLVRRSSISEKKLYRRVLPTF
jgi:hypothetical protein